jgi:DNA-binding Xre family transcriptional regulator
MPGHTAACPTSDAYRIPKHRTRCLRLLSAHTSPIHALRGITQADLAEKAGISQTAVAEFEKDKRDLRTSTVVKLCEALGVQVTYKVDGTEITGP